MAKDTKIVEGADIKKTVAKAASSGSGSPDDNNDVNNNTGVLLKELQSLSKTLQENTVAANALLKNVDRQYNRAGELIDSYQKTPKAAIDQLKEELTRAQKEKAELQRDQAAFNLEQSKQYAAKRAEDEAKTQLKKEEEARNNAYKDSGLYKAGSAISQASGGFGSSTLLSMATGGLVNPAVAHALGLDKVMSAGLGWAGKKIGNALGASSQRKKEEQQKQQAHDKAISNALEKAQLDKDIQEALAAHGFVTDKNKGKADKPKKTMKEATDENPNEGVEKKLDQLNTTVEAQGKVDKPEEKEKEEGLFGKIFGFIGMLGGVLMGFLSKGTGLLKTVFSFAGKAVLGGLKKVPGLLWNTLKLVPKLIWGGLKMLPGLVRGAFNILRTVGPMIGRALVAAGPLLGGAIAFAVGGLIGKYLAGKAVDAIDKNTNLLGGQTARQSMNALSKVSGDQNLKDYQTRTGDFAGYTMMKQYQQQTLSEEQGKLWGKNEKAIARRKAMLGRTAKEALEASNPELAAGIATEIAEKKLSEAEGWDLYIKAADEGAKNALEENKGLSIEQIKAKQAAKREAKNGKAETQVEQQDTGHPAKKTLSYDEKMEKLDKLVADGELTQEQAEQVKEELNIGSRDFTRGRSATVNNYNEIPTNDMPSESTMNSMAAARQNSAQMSQMSQNITNTNNAQNSSDVYQTNITQYSDTPIYATGDVARTMLTN